MCERWLLAQTHNFLEVPWLKGEMTRDNDHDLERSTATFLLCMKGEATGSGSLLTLP